MPLDALFDGTFPYGVYRIGQSESLADWESLCLKNDFSFFLLDGTIIRNEDDFMKQYKVVLQPDEYGENWNSLLSSLRLTRWLTTKGVIIVYDNIQNFMTAERESFDIALEVFTEAINFCNQKREHPQVKPLYILLRGDDTVDLQMNWL